MPGLTRMPIGGGGGPGINDRGPMPLGGGTLALNSGGGILTPGGGIGPMPGGGMRPGGNGGRRIPEYGGNTFGPLNGGCL